MFCQARRSRIQSQSLSLLSLKTVPRDSTFLRWMADQVRLYKWSLDTCAGYARRNNLFPIQTIPGPKTLYNLLWKGELPLTRFELPEILSRRKHRKPRVSKRLNGKKLESGRPKWTREIPLVIGNLMRYLCKKGGRTDSVYDCGTSNRPPSCHSNRRKYHRRHRQGHVASSCPVWRPIYRHIPYHHHR